MSTSQGEVEDLLRELAPQVLAALVRWYGQFHLCEDARLEALLAAALQWPSGGQPENPRGWLITVASRRLMDQVRTEQARRTREELIAVATPQSELLGPPADAAPADSDDSLALLFGCCHPDLSSPSQIALTLRAVGGLSTAQIAAAFGVPEATMAQRISRAKQTISGTGFDFSLPADAERTERLRAVLHVLYLVFNEGYTATAGDALTVPTLSQEAIRLTRWLHRLLRSARTSCKRPSPPSTTRPRPWPTPTGRRSSDFTTCWNVPRRTHLPRSTVRWPWPWCTGPTRG